MLRLRPTSLHSQLLKGDGRIVWYEVEGLPTGQRAKIAEVGGRWRILQKRDEIPTAWEGEYATAEAALAALQSAISD